MVTPMMRQINFGDHLLLKPGYDLTMFFKYEIDKLQDVDDYGDDHDKPEILKIMGKVAIIDINGPLRPGNDLWYGTGYDDIIEASKSIRQRASIETVILKIDSPGGTVKGAFETTDELWLLAAEKKLIAITTGSMTSAALLLAFPANERYISSPTNEVGSIGVRAIHADEREWFALWGMKLTSVAKGELKDAGISIRGYDEKAKAVYEYSIGKLYDVFIDAAADGLPLTREEIMAQESAIYIGDDAIKAGLVDGYAKIEDFFTPPDNPVFFNIMKGNDMDLSKIKKDFPDECEAIDKEAYDRGVLSMSGEKEAGIKEERSRQKGIREMGAKHPGCDAVITEMLNDGTPIDKAAVKILDSIATTRDKKKEEFEASTNGPVVIDTDTAEMRTRTDDEQETDSGNDENSLKKKWDSSADLRAEFDSFESYAAYAKANEGGQVKIYGGRKLPDDKE